MQKRGLSHNDKPLFLHSPSDIADDADDGFVRLGQIASPLIGQDDVPIVQIGPQGKILRFHGRRIGYSQAARYDSRADADAGQGLRRGHVRRFQSHGRRYIQGFDKGKKEWRSSCPSFMTRKGWPSRL